MTDLPCAPMRSCSGGQSYELFVGSWGTLPVQDAAGWESVVEALNMENDLVGARVGSKGVMIQVCRPAGRTA
jgi:hypothetical protein